MSGKIYGREVIYGKRFNESNGTTPTDGVQVEAYIGFNTAHAGGNMRYPVYEYEVNGVTYRRAKTGVSYNSGHVAKMKDKPCRVMYNAADPGDSKAK